MSRRFEHVRKPKHVTEDDIDLLMDLYDFKTRPFRHQAFEFIEYRNHPERAMLWQMRSGKSKATIDIACYNYQEGWIDCVLVVAPNGVHDNWIRRQLPIHHWDSVPRNELVWRMSEFTKRKGNEEKWMKRFDKALESDKLLWIAINSESLINKKTRKILKKLVAKRRVFMAFDESDDFRVPGAKRTKMMRAVKRKSAMRRIMTGTVITNTPLAGYSQYELLKDGALGFDKYEDYKNHYAEYKLETGRGGRKYPVLDKYKNLDDLRERMSYFSTVVLRKDCPDLPELIQYERFIEPTSQQLKIYRKLQKEFMVYLGEEEVSVGETSTRLFKMQQVLSGFLIDEYKDVHEIPGGNPRLDALIKEIDGDPKTIVWCMFHEDIIRVMKRLKKEGFSPVEYHGRVNHANRNKAIDKFMGRENVGPFVGQPGAGGRGLDLSAARQIVHYSHTFNGIHRAQSEERGTKAGGHSVASIDLIVPDSVDTYIRQSVEEGLEIADHVSGKGMREILESISL